jgi:2-methylaconitate cis-trans-isomerase PrpF
MRGGTSKGVFCHLDELPPDGPARDRFLLALMGSHDPMQLDGLGGTHSSTSKVMAVGPGRQPGTDVEYLFAQVGVDRPMVDYAGNCGNLTAAVGPYAFDEGLVEIDSASTRQLTLLNLNTGVRVRASFEVADGRAAWEGDCVIDGVPGSGAPVVTDYLDPAGSVTGKLFPTGSPKTVIDGLEVSLVDVATPYAFVRASDLGLSGAEAPDVLNADAQLLARLERLRAACGDAIGVASAAVPRLVLVSEPSTPTGLRSPDLRVRATSMQKVHHAAPITAALCTAAAVQLQGTVAADVARIGPTHDGRADPSPRRIVRMEHPKGLVEASVEFDGDRVRAAGVVRTARRLLAGTAFVPNR